MWLGAWMIAFGLPASAGEGTVIYAERTELVAGQVVHQEVHGSPWVVAADGQVETVDFEHLTDSLGRTYAIVNDARQDSETSPVIVESRLVRFDGLRPPREAVLATSSAQRTVLSDRLVARLAAAGPDDMINVTISLPPVGRAIPPMPRGLEATDPVFHLERAIERIEAVEWRKTATERAQEFVRADLEALGAHVYRPLWGINAIQASVAAAGLEELAGHPSVVSIELLEPIEAYGNTGAQILEALQVQQFLDAGIDGEVPSGGVPGASDIVLIVADTTIDHNHPVWLDCASCGSRLTRVECIDGNAVSPCNPPVAESCLGGTDPTPFVQDGSCTAASTLIGGSKRQHGTRVAAQAVADLMDNQISGSDDLWERERTGMSPETSLVFIDAFGYGQDADQVLGANDAALERALELGADVLNVSWGRGDCNPESSINRLVEELYLAGIFVVTAVPNSGHSTSACTMTSPNTAPGAFAVGAVQKDDPNLQTAALADYTSRGGDVHGRDMVMLVAPSGRGQRYPAWPGTLAEYDDGFGGMQSTAYGTSFAAPLVAGAAANLKHLLTVEGLGPNDRGGLYAWMMLMGDGLDGTSTSTDEVAGLGRVRMRMPSASGMDTPWRTQQVRLLLWDGAEYEFPLNDVGGANQVLSTDVEGFRAAFWWYEPNPAWTGSNAVADIDLSLARSGLTVTASSGSPQQRIIRRADVGGFAWTARVVGTAVPPNDSGAYLSGIQFREGNLAWYWEDSDRDDADGPAAGIE